MPPSFSASNLQCSYNMIEDYVQTLLPPISQSPANCFVAVQNQAQPVILTELVSTSTRNNLLRFHPDDHSDSGWSHEEVLVDGAPLNPIQKIISFYQSKTLYALAHYQAASGDNHHVIGMQRTAASGWALMPFDANLKNALGLMRQTDSFQDSQGGQFFYGVSQGFQPASFVIVAEAASGKWVPVFLEPEADPAATYRLLPGIHDNQLTVVTVSGSVATFRGGSIINGTLRFSGVPVKHDLGQGTISAEQVFAVPSESGDQGFLLLGKNNALFHVAAWDSPIISVTPLTGAAGQPSGVAMVSVGRLQQGAYAVFAADSVGQRLWILRQAPSAAGDVTFGQWAPLGNNLGALSSPPAMGTGPELLFYDLSGSVRHMCQQLEEGNWFAKTVASPSPATDQPVRITTYTYELVSVDDAGTPVPGTVLKVFADQPSILMINGLSYHADSVTPAEVVTDMNARATVAAVSTALISPTLNVKDVKGAVLGQPYRADLRIHQRIAGQDPSFVVSGDSMKAAGLIPGSLSPEDADELAAKTRSLGQAAVQMQNVMASNHAFRTDVIEVCHWEVDFTKDRDFSRILEPNEAAQLRVNASNSLLSDIWGDICNFFREVVDELKKLAVSIKDGIIYVAVTMAKDIKYFVLKTLADVAGCMEIFLAAVASIAGKIVDAIERAVRWLRMLFNWEDILRTKKVISYYIDQTLKNVSADLTGDIPKKVIAEFNRLKGDIVAFFNDLESVFKPGVDFNKFGPPSSSNPASKGGPPLAGLGLTTLYGDNAVQCNYVSSKMRSGLTSTLQDVLAAAPTSFDPSKLLVLFEETFPIKELEESWKKIRDFTAQIQDAKSFLEVVILDLLEVVKDLLLLIISGIEAILVALSAMAGLAFQGLDVMLTLTIHIPIISQIYKEISGADLSLLDLFSLIAAVPATVLYKLLYGGTAATPPFTEADVEIITSQPIPWPSFSNAQGDSTRTLRAPLGISLDRALTTVFMIACLPYFVLDIGLDLKAAAEASGGGATATGLDLKPEVLAGFLAIFVSATLQGFGVPYAAMVRIDKGEGTKADVWAVVSWCAAWLPTLFDAAFAMGSESRKITRFQLKWGPFLSCAAGLVMIGCGSKAVDEMRNDKNYGRASETQVLMPCFPYIFQPVVLLGLDSPPSAVAQGVLCLIDAVCDIGMGVAAEMAVNDAPELGDRAYA